MATFQELDDLSNDETLQAKFRTAVKASANVVVDAFIVDPLTVTDQEITWSRNTLRDARYEGQRALNIFLWDKKGQDPTVIQSTSEAQIKNRVEAIAPFLIKAASIA